MKQSAEIVVAVDRDDLRTRIVEILEGSGYSPTVLPSSEKLRHPFVPKENTFIIIGTEDVAALNQIVYHLYKSFGESVRGSIIAIVSEETMERNPRLGFWDIDGGAALGCLLIAEGNQYDRIPCLIRHLIQQVQHLIQ